MNKYGYIFNPNYRIKLIPENKRKDKTNLEFGILAKWIKSGGRKQDNGLFLNPLPTEPTSIPNLYYLKDRTHKDGKKITLLCEYGVVYMSVGTTAAYFTESK